MGKQTDRQTDRDTVRQTCREAVIQGGQERGGALGPVVAGPSGRNLGTGISFQACANYWSKLWSPVLSSLLMLKSITPDHKAIRV